ncbi:MAG: DUF1990 domain-containing protein [Acidimicrobiales bacterium]|nr:DUF1990 domain-containing protein [Acidimicrobiales bacterium]
MRLGGFGPVGEAELERLRVAAPTYDHVGSTLRSQPVPGVNRHEQRLAVGRGRADLEAARLALRAWAPQRALGATVSPAGVTPDLDATVVLGIGVGPARVRFANRIVVVIDEPDRHGYAYGTLPGHPERGEESFVVGVDRDGTVWATIRTDSEPAGPLGALAPVLRPVQRAAIGRYLSAVARAVRSGRGSPPRSG